MRLENQWWLPPVFERGFLKSSSPRLELIETEHSKNKGKSVETRSLHALLVKLCEDNFPTLNAPRRIVMIMKCSETRCVGFYFVNTSF